MRVLVIRVGSIDIFPPAISLVDALTDLGHEVTLMANDAPLLPAALQSRPNMHLVDLGPVPPFPLSVLEGLDARRQIRNYLKTHVSDFDVVWTTTDISARDAGDALLDTCHVMQMAELVETVPLYTHAQLPVKSSRVQTYAQKAFKVVVPEYNRAHIQRTWWDLPQVPTVLPNKPSSSEAPDPQEASAELWKILSAEKRKILLYQGVYASDRNLVPFAQSLEYLGDEYALYLMGKPLDQSQAEVIASLCADIPNVHDLGYVPAPRHRAFTSFGHIGLLPYVPSSSGRFSKLNALYCAPNKIWEYAACGLPMVGSDVPGLEFAFKEGGIGLTTDCSDPRSIAAAVQEIDRRYDEMSANSRQYYGKVDVKSVVGQIMDEATVYLREKQR